MKHPKKNNFRDLGAILKKRTSKEAFSEIPPVPLATPERQQELRELNKWLRHYWCRKEFFVSWRTGLKFWSVTHDWLATVQGTPCIEGEG